MVITENGGPHEQLGVITGGLLKVWNVWKVWFAVLNCKNLTYSVSGLEEEVGKRIDVFNQKKNALEVDGIWVFLTSLQCDVPVRFFAAWSPPVMQRRGTTWAWSPHAAARKQ